MLVRKLFMFVMRWITGTKMSNDYSDKITDSDLDAFKSDGEVETASITFNQSVGGGNEVVKSDSVTVSNPDFIQILYDNSSVHSGQFKPIQNHITSIPDSTTFGGYGTLFLYVEVSGNTITMSGKYRNPYSGSNTIGPLTINFRVIPYQATIG